MATQNISWVSKQPTGPVPYGAVLDISWNLSTTASAPEITSTAATTAPAAVTGPHISVVHVYSTLATTAPTASTPESIRAAIAHIASTLQTTGPVVSNLTSFDVAEVLNATTVAAMGRTAVLEALDSLVFSDAITAAQAFAVLESIVFSDSSFAQQIFSQAVAEQLSIKDALGNIINLLNQDTMDLSAPVQETINRMLIARDVLSILSPSATQAELTLLIATSVAMHTALEAALLLLAGDVLTVTDEVAELRDVFVRIMENLTLDAAPVASSSFVVLGSDSLAMFDEAANFANFIIAVEDAISFAGVITLPDGSQYTAWATTLSTRAPYKYTNYPFNSFATHDDKHYGLTYDGLYLLEGDDDAGTAIDAHIKTGLMDFGTSNLKNVRRAYLGYSSDGKLYLRVIDTDDGDKREVTYELDQTHGATKEARIVLGQGVKARYFQFELANVDGSDFSLDELDILPVILTRRV